MEIECNLPGMTSIKAVTRLIYVDDSELQKESGVRVVENLSFEGARLHVEVKRLLKREFRLTLIVEELDPEKSFYWSYSAKLEDGSVPLGNTWSRVLTGRHDFPLVLTKDISDEDYDDKYATEFQMIFQFVLLREKMVETSSSQTELSLTGKTDKLSKDLKVLLESGEESDVTVCVGNGSSEFRAHRNILAARSPVLAAAFERDVFENRTEVLDIVGWEAETVLDFLFFLYTGYVENLTSKNAIRLYEMADKYQVEDLKEVCLDCIENNLMEDGICDVFRLAQKFGIQRLTERATDFFVCNVKNIVATDQWRSFLCQAPNQANKCVIKVMEGAVGIGSEKGKRKKGRSTPPSSSQKKIKVKTISDDSDDS